jgi:hypothetical protein
MYQSIVTSGGDTLLLSIPVVACAVFYVFRLDEVTRKLPESAGRPRSMCGMDDEGEPIPGDPDGRVVGKRNVCK